MSDILTIIDLNAVCEGNLEAISDFMLFRSCDSQACHCATVIP